MCLMLLSTYQPTNDDDIDSDNSVVTPSIPNFRDHVLVSTNPFNHCLHLKILVETTLLTHTHLDDRAMYLKKASLLVYITNMANNCCTFS